MPDFNTSKALDFSAGSGRMYGNAQAISLPDPELLRRRYDLLVNSLRASNPAAVHHLLFFDDLTEGEFESIMRRFCVIKVFARFFDKQYLSKHLPVHEELGIFARRYELYNAFFNFLLRCNISLVGVPHLYYRWNSDLRNAS